MSSTSLKDLFDVEISSATKGVTEVGFGTVMILGSTGFGASSDIVRTYSADLTQVAADFNSSAPEYVAAASILEQNPTIQQIKIGKRGALVAQVSNVLVGNAQDSHVYTVQVNGVAYNFTSGVGATLSGIAAGLLAALQAGLPSYIVATSGAGASINLTATVAGNAFSVIAADVDLTPTTVTANHGVSEDIAAIQAVDDDWYVLALTSRLANDILNAAAYIESQLKIFGACNADSDVLTTAGTSVLDKLFALKYNRTFFLWSNSQATYPELGWMATSFYTPGQETWAYKTAAGSVASKLSATQRLNVRNKHGNTYESYAGNDVFLFGIMVSGEYIDVIRLRDWTVSQMQSRLFSASINLAKVPYDDDGGTIYHSILLGVLTDGVDNGGYVKGSTIVNVPLVKKQSQANRQARKMAGITFSATLASAVHTGAINGVVTV